MRRAAAMAIEAKALFQNGEFVDAARLFMEAYAISKHATLIFNAARAYEQAGQLKRAESLFKLYLSMAGDDEAGRADATARLEAVRARLSVAEPKPPEPLPPPPPAPPQPPLKAPEARPRWPFVAAGVTALAAGGLYGFAYQQSGDLDVAKVVDEPSRRAYADQRDRAQLLRWAAVGGGVAAVGLVALGAVLRRRTTEPTGVPAPLPTGGAATPAAALAPEAAWAPDGAGGWRLDLRWSF